MNIFKIAGKYLDQPILVSKFEKKVPLILTTGGIANTVYVTKKEEPQKQKETLLRTGTTTMFTVLSALAAPKIANKIFNKKSTNLKEIIINNKKVIDEHLKLNNCDEKSKKILEKAKDKVLSFNEIKKLYSTASKDEVLLNKLIPNPENITSKEIFSEIGRLSLLGLIPVIGGISGGVAGDFVTSKDWKARVPNKIKEGTYQYLANIFLCNIGAGVALALMEKAGVKSKNKRAFGMIAGIFATGVIGGSMIANIIGNKFINPIFGKEKHNNVYAERKPEALDIGLHVDDIATVAVMSGLKWIEPALPFMYAISGYRAGIGYRNVNKCNENNKS